MLHQSDPRRAVALDLINRYDEALAELTMREAAILDFMTENQDMNWISKALGWAPTLPALTEELPSIEEPTPKVTEPPAVEDPPEPMPMVVIGGKYPPRIDHEKKKRGEETGGLKGTMSRIELASDESRQKSCPDPNEVAANAAPWFPWVTPKLVKSWMYTKYRNRVEKDRTFRTRKLDDPHAAGVTEWLYTNDYYRAAVRLGLGVVPLDGRPVSYCYTWLTTEERAIVHNFVHSLRERKLTMSLMDRDPA